MLVNVRRLFSSSRDIGATEQVSEEDGCVKMMYRFRHGRIGLATAGSCTDRNQTVTTSHESRSGSVRKCRFLTCAMGSGACAHGLCAQEEIINVAGATGFRCMQPRLFLAGVS